MSKMLHTYAWLLFIDIIAWVIYSFYYDYGTDWVTHVMFGIVAIVTFFEDRKELKKLGNGTICWVWILTGPVYFIRRAFFTKDTPTAVAGAFLTGFVLFYLFVPSMVIMSGDTNRSKTAYCKSITDVLHSNLEYAKCREVTEVERTSGRRYKGLVTLNNGKEVMFVAEWSDPLSYEMAVHY